MTKKEPTNEELARYFKARRGDVSDWAEKPTRIRVRRGGPSTVFSIRFAEDELSRLQNVADARGITVSELIRTAALKEAGRPPAEVENLEQAAAVLRGIADLMTSKVAAEPQDMDARIAESFVPGRTYVNVPKPIKAPVFGAKRPPAGERGNQEESVSTRRQTQRSD
jgi:hypothetical protein